MDFKRKREEVIGVLKEMDIPYEIDTADVIKMNDMHLYGIVFQQGDIGKTLYLNEFADADLSAAEMAEELLTACETSADIPPFELMDNLASGQSLSEISDNLFVALVGDERNKEFLDQVVSKRVGSGLSFICQIRFNTGDGVLSTNVTKELAVSNHWDEEELFTLATVNSSEKNPAVLCRMNDALFMDNRTDLLESEEKVIGEMMILSNRTGLFGAAAMFLPGVIDKIHEKIEEAFFAIPSSVHEFIIIPESSGMTMPALNAMCREANESVVRYNEILSDNVLYMPYNR